MKKVLLLCAFIALFASCTIETLQIDEQQIDKDCQTNPHTGVVTCYPSDDNGEE